MLHTNLAQAQRVKETSVLNILDEKAEALVDLSQKICQRIVSLNERLFGPVPPDIAPESDKMKDPSGFLPAIDLKLGILISRNEKLILGLDSIIERLG
jgi:hypothetical protein